MQPTRFLHRAEGTPERLAGFMAHLRLNGLMNGFRETEDALNAIQGVDPMDVQEMRLALKAICARDEEKFGRFDDLFNAYWLNRGLESKKFVPAPTNKSYVSGLNNRTGTAASGLSGEDGEAETPDDDGEGEGASSKEGRLQASKTTAIEKTDFRKLMMPQEMEKALAIAERLARAIRDRRSRRRKAAKKGAGLDLRRIARHSVSSGGEPMQLFRRRKPDRPVHLVVLLDVSGSMTVYAQVFLAFFKGLIAADQRTDAFLFHTRLVNISDALRDHDTLRAVNRLTMMSQGFGGGTRIAGNIERFNRHYASRTVNSRSVVIILSDGYDTDGPDAMESALARLKKRGCKILWLNPLKGWKDYEPVARGMAAALPHLDLFAEAHTLESLAALESHLAGV